MDAPPPLTAEQCRALCDGRFCGVQRHPDCGDVVCGTCRDDSYCDEEFAQCVIRSQDPPPPPPPDTRPRWRIRVVAATVSDCGTRWDTCRVPPPLCTPSLPDPIVRIEDRYTREASNTCAGRYDVALGEFPADQLQSGLRMALLDNDGPSSSVAGEDICPLFMARFTEAEIAAGRKTFPCPGGSIGVTLTPLP